LRKNFKYVFLFVVISSCIEPYEFVIINDDPVLVVDGNISDKSFNETLLYPSDGRHFTVRISLTGNVINTRPQMISGASVHLVSDQNGYWEYTETDPASKPGVYVLLDPDFKAAQNTQYRLRITLPGEDVYESEWEALPVAETPEIGEIGFIETDVLANQRELGEIVIKTVKGITGNINVPENSTGSPLYYRWEYTPTWIYQAPLSRSASNPGHRCWATDDQYLNDYTLQLDLAGGYKKELFFMQTIRNARIFEDFSLLVTQQSLTEPYYYFWKEMQEQSEGGAIFDKPPYNVKTNLVSLNGDKRVIGYFGVVGEQARRWFFNWKDVSYNVPNTLYADCTVPFQDIAPECFDCTQYSFGTVTTVKPAWWR
jgi:Domain of unknown function (DUF4249)